MTYSQVMSAQMISHYRVVRRLGAGGMGVVFLAEDTTLERQVAVKLMSAELARDSTKRKRFRAEAKAASGLSHPNICVIHEVGETEDGRPFLAMEYIEGQTLETLLRQRKLMPLEVLAIGIQVAEALDAAHSRRVIHRDIKPANIMLDRRGQAKVLDFGLAKRLATDGLSDTSVLSLTQTGMLIGTPYYMSPEQLLGREVDSRSDIFSLGVVLYELASGQKPFLGMTMGEVINTVVNQQPELLNLENPRFSPALDTIIFKCLEKDPQNRYATARQLATDLGRLKQDSEAGHGGGVGPTSSASLSNPTKLWQLSGKPVRSPNRSPTVVAGFAVLLVLGALALFLVADPVHRIAISLGEVLAASLAAYWWFARSTRSAIRNHPAPPANPAQPSEGQGSQAGRGDPPGRGRSLAVLPFANFSAEKDSDYLSDGLTEEITSTLARLPSLKVAARNSAFAFKGRHEDARKIGEALRVTMLLEGSVRKAGRQIRVTAQLINAADGYQIWSETFDRDVRDVIAVQDEIARRIAERLRMEIGAETSAAMAQRRAVNPEAHVAYLQGRHNWNKRTQADLERAVQLFRKAIDLDPAYADAYAGLAASYVVLPGYAYRPASEYLPLACGAARRALELDSTSAEAHAVLGDAAAQAWDFDTALAHLRRSIELNPNGATGHQWYGEALKELGRMDEALLEFRKAEELDPLSPIIRACIPEWLYLSGRNDESIAEAKRAMEIFPEFSSLVKFYVQALIRKGLYREALAEVVRARASTPNVPARLDLLSFCQARLGNESKARAALAELEKWRTQGYDVDEELGLANLGLRQYGPALEAYKRFAVSGILRGSALRNPLLADEMGDHPGFQALLRKVDPGKTSG